jgi:hypothetical protein
MQLYAQTGERQYLNVGFYDKTRVITYSNTNMGSFDETNVVYTILML